jgi:hypothetical protein
MKILSFVIVALALIACGECRESAAPVNAWWFRSCDPGATVELINNGTVQVCHCPKGAR